MFSRGKATSGAPICSGIIALANPANSGRREQQQHDRAVHREQLVVLLRVVDDLQPRRDELGADEQREHAAEQEPGRTR